MHYWHQYSIRHADQTYTDTKIDGDIYIEQGVTLTTSGNTIINGSIYVFGTLENKGTLTVTDKLYCLHIGTAVSVIGDYDYGYLYTSGDINGHICVTPDYLSDGIPEVKNSTVKKMSQNLSAKAGKKTLVKGKTTRSQPAGKGQFHIPQAKRALPR